MVPQSDDVSVYICKQFLGLFRNQILKRTLGDIMCDNNFQLTKVRVPKIVPKVVFWYLHLTKFEISTKKIFEGWKLCT